MHSLFSALQLPEVLHLIARQLDVRSSISCQVCRLWSDHFTPYVVKSIDGRERLWPIMRRKVPRLESISCPAWITLTKKYKDHIRHLDLCNHWLLGTALQIEIKHFTLVTISLARETSFDPTWLFDGLPELDHIFHNANWNCASNTNPDRTRACWQLILNNPGLQSPVFEHPLLWTLRAC